MTIDDKTARAWLQLRKRELQNLQSISEEARSAVELDQQSVGRLSRVDALQGQAMAQEQQRRRQQDLIRIEAAFRRIEDGEYGACLKCGDDIADKRLEVDPMATLCITCAGIHEK